MLYANAKHSNGRDAQTLMVSQTKDSSFFSLGSLVILSQVHHCKELQIIKGYGEMPVAILKNKFLTLPAPMVLRLDPLTHRCPDNNARVEFLDCSLQRDVGATELRLFGMIQTFKSDQRAFYYAGFLKIHCVQMVNLGCYS